MNNFRRNKKITDAEINAFKEAEINKLLQQTKKPTQNNYFKRPMVLASAFILTTLLIVLSIFIFTLNDEKLDYRVTQLSYNEYLLESEVDQQNFTLYYKASVIQPGQRTSYNDTFDYFTPYTYASNNISNQYPVDFNVFKVGQYRYYLEINYNNESSYIRIHSNKLPIRTWELKGLEIDDLEEDMSDIYELIELYPPQFYKMNITVPMYLRHPDINLLADSKAKRNYIQYVENNFYVPQDYEVDDMDIDERDNQTYTVLLSQMIIVNQQGEYIDSYISRNQGFEDDISFVEYFPDWKDGFFSFYLNGEDEPFQKMVGSLNTRANNEDADVYGYYKIGSYNQKLYLYTYVSLIYSNVDLSEAHRGEIDYTLSNEFDYLEGSLQFEFLDYDHGLIMPPFIISDDIDTTDIFDIFDSLTYRFYDINGTLICEFIK
ncbi:hypothetical protein KHQ88_07390 [Mycoplasmatota bacterium]|nr:hypothetical protein KHQ88_07390 [Mycoplasmatota bacterium]